MRLAKTTKVTHNRMRKTIDAYADALGPPSSPPITTLLTAKTVKHVTEAAKKTYTEYARSPAGVSYGTGGV